MHDTTRATRGCAVAWACVGQRYHDALRRLLLPACLMSCMLEVRAMTLERPRCHRTWRRSATQMSTKRYTGTADPCRRRRSTCDAKQGQRGAATPAPPRAPQPRPPTGVSRPAAAAPATAAAALPAPPAAAARRRPCPPRRARPPAAAAARRAARSSCAPRAPRHRDALPPGRPARAWTLTLSCVALPRLASGKAFCFQGQNYFYIARRASKNMLMRPHVTQRALLNIGTCMHAPRVEIG